MANDDISVAQPFNFVTLMTTTMSNVRQLQQFVSVTPVVHFYMLMKNSRKDSILLSPILSHAYTGMCSRKFLHPFSSYCAPYLCWTFYSGKQMNIRVEKGRVMREAAIVYSLNLHTHSQLLFVWHFLGIVNNNFCSKYFHADGVTEVLVL